MPWIIDDETNENLFIPHQWDFYENGIPKDVLAELKLENKKPILPKKKPIKKKTKFTSKDDAFLNKAVKENEKHKKKFVPNIQRKTSPYDDGGRLDALRKAEYKKTLDFSTKENAIEMYKTLSVNIKAKLELFLNIRSVENGAEDKMSIVMWESMSSCFMKLFPPKDSFSDIPEKDYYLTVLSNFVCEYSLNTVREMRDSKIFDVYPPSTHPVVICTLQKGVQDIFPRGQFLMPFALLKNYGFIPHNALEFNPFNCKLLCFSLFWSLSSRMSTLGCMYDGGDRGILFHWIVFDRKAPGEPSLDNYRHQEITSLPQYVAIENIEKF